MIGNFIGVLFDGIAYGSLLFVISIGLSVTMGLMNFVNLAHGAFAMVGGYACTLLMTRAGVPFLAKGRVVHRTRAVREFFGVAFVDLPEPRIQDITRYVERRLAEDLRGERAGSVSN